MTELANDQKAIKKLNKWKVRIGLLPLLLLLTVHHGMIFGTKPPLVGCTMAPYCYHPDTGCDAGYDSTPYNIVCENGWWIWCGLTQ